MSLLLTLGLGGSGTPPTPPTGGDTPYMNLLLPTVSITLGPLYATEVNQAFLRVDAHDHSDGFGKLVGTNGLNINADLTFHGFKATNLDAAGFNIRTPTAGLVGQVYMSGEDLYCVDGAGNVIQITAAGAVNVSGLGSWTGLTAPAQASYNSVTKKFSLKSNTTGPVYGLLEVGDIILFPGDPNLGTLPFIRIATPNAGVSSYTLQLPPSVPSVVGSKQLLLLNHDGTMTLGPPLPAATSFLRMDSTGTPAADVTIDNSTLQLLGAGPFILRVAPQGIGVVQLADGNVTQIKQGPMANGAHAPVTSSATGAGPVTIADVVVSALGAASGRPVIVSAWPLGSTTGTIRIVSTGAVGGLAQATFEIVNITSGVVHASWNVDIDDVAGTYATCQMPQFIPCLAGVVVGNNTFRLRVKAISTGCTVEWFSLTVYATQL